MPLQVPGDGTVTPPDNPPPDTTGQTSWPNPATGRAVTDWQYSRLASPWTGIGGLLGLPSDLPLIHAPGTGRLVMVRASRLAQVYGFTWQSGNTEVPIQLAANATGATRLDLIVLGLDRATWNVAVYAKAGSATLPALTQDTGLTGRFEIPLAAVAVPNAAVTLAPTAVTSLAWHKAQPTFVANTSVPLPHSPGQIRYTPDQPGMGYSTGTAWRTLLDDTKAGRGIIYAYKGGAATNLDPHTGTWMSTRSLAVPANRSLRLDARVGVTTTTGFTAVEVFININGQAETVGDSGPANIPAGRFTSVYASEFNYSTNSTGSPISVSGTARLTGAGGQKVTLTDFYFTVEDRGPAVPYTT